MAANFIATPSLPILTLSATGAFVGTGAEFDLPTPTLTATLESNYMRATPVLPGPVSVSATMLTGAGFTAAASLYPAQVTATLLQEAVFTFTPSLPKVSLSAQMLSGLLLSGSPILLAPTLSAAIRTDGTFTATFALPPVQLSAEVQQAVAAAFRTWALNLRNSALTEYDTFPFNSYAVFNGQVLACGTGGVFVLGSQALDGAANITAKARTGASDFDTSLLSRVPRLYVGCSTGGDILFRTITSQNGTRTYRLAHNDVTGVQQRRVPVGKGPKARYWQFEVENEAGADFSVYDILAYPLALRRRVM